MSIKRHPISCKKGLGAFVSDFTLQQNGCLHFQLRKYAIPIHLIVCCFYCFLRYRLSAFSAAIQFQHTGILCGVELAARGDKGTTGMMFSALDKHAPVKHGNVKPFWLTPIGRHCRNITRILAEFSDDMSHTPASLSLKTTEIQGALFQTTVSAPCVQGRFPASVLH